MKITDIEIGNFRKLQSVRIGISDKTTVFVGANNSGKTSAMTALRYFLVERQRARLSLNDFTLLYWPLIDEMGVSWEQAQLRDETLPEPDWEPVLPFLDVWLHVEKKEAYLVQKIIPTLDWDGGRLGVRLRLEPKDFIELQKSYLVARSDVQKIEAAESKEKAEISKDNVVFWPRSLTDFIQRRFGTFFKVSAYILDPEKLRDPEFGKAKPQALSKDVAPLEVEPFKGLIRVDEIGAQRGFGQVDGSRLGDDDDAVYAGSASARRMSDQLRLYWNKHLDPFENPDPEDIKALRAIDQAQRAFDDRLRDGFSAAIKEVEGVGYPGISDPRLKISSRLKPIDGLNHSAAVQYVVPAGDGEDAIELNLPEDSNGLGYQNLISMIFRLMSFRDAWMRVGKAGSQRSNTSQMLVPPLHLVLIEEPEAHLHTQVQQVFIRQAYRVLRKHPVLGESSDRITQLLVSTHSSHIAHECDFDCLRYFRRLPAKDKAIPVSSVVNLGTVFGEDLETKRFATRYIKVTHCDLFFADAAVLVEGPAERILVPFWVRHHTELSALNECYVTWLEIGGSHAHRLRPLIEHLGLISLIITDLDAKDGENRSAIPVRGASLKSRNATLNTWCPQKDDIDSLLDLTSEDKCKSYDDQYFSVRVAYQCPVKINFKGKEVEALTNTLEDALVVQNLELFKDGEGTGLWGKFKKAISESASYDDLSARVLEALKSGGKAEFALSLLEIESPSKLKAPFYIDDGLRWLTAQLKKHQEELGVSVSSDTSKEEGQLADGD
tara:strand:+ start:1034 stop:3361 length:2328 start_codon:yes stop_codon:yes gene_type:complete